MLAGKLSKGQCCKELLVSVVVSSIVISSMLFVLLLADVSVASLLV